MPEKNKAEFLEKVQSAFIHLYSDMLSQPVFMEPTRLAAMRDSVEGLLKKINGKQDNSELYNFLILMADSEEEERPLDVQDGIAAIPVTRTLTNLPADHFLIRYGIYDSYDHIRAQYDEAVSRDDVKAIRYDMDSPGGMHSGMMETVDYLYKMKGAKPVVAMVDEGMYSAAYGVGSTADEIWITRSSGVGSIGTLLVHEEESKLLERVGITVTDFTYGKKKAQAAWWKPLSAGAKIDLQAMVDDAGREFTAAVARNLNTTFEFVKSLEAGVYEGKKAIDIGLADRVVSAQSATDEIKKRYIKNTKENDMKLTDISNYLYNFLSGDLKADTERMLDGLGFAPKATAQVPDTEAIKAEAKQAGIEEGKAIAKEDAKREAEADAKKASTDRALEILDLCNTAEMPGKAAEYIGSDKSKEDIQKELTDAKASAASQHSISSTVSATGTGEHNPVMADAQKRADAAKRA